MYRLEVRRNILAGAAAAMGFYNPVVQSACVEDDEKKNEEPS